MDDLGMNTGAGPAKQLTLPPAMRRVLGVLIEKSLATPEYYPMTLKALVAGCNQKSNRAPLMALSDDEVLDGLSALRDLKLVIAVKDTGSRATRWRQELQRIFNLQGRELAVLAELLIRGPQTEGELRTRASRMKPVEDLDILHHTLENLRDRQPTFAFRLSPEGVMRGVRHAHALYPEEELEHLKAEAEEHGAALEGTSAIHSPRASEEMAELRERVTGLEARLARLEESLGVVD